MRLSRSEVTKLGIPFPKAKKQAKAQAQYAKTQAKAAKAQAKAAKKSKP